MSASRALYHFRSENEAFVDISDEMLARKRGDLQNYVQSKDSGQRIAALPYSCGWYAEHSLLLELSIRHFQQK